MEHLREFEMPERETSTTTAHIIAAAIGVWRAVVIAGLIGIGGVLYSTVLDVRSLLDRGITTTRDLTRVENAVTDARSAITVISTAVQKTQTTLESGIQQILVDQNRRIGAMEDRNARLTDLLSDTQREIAGMRAELQAICRVSGCSPPAAKPNNR